MVIIAAAVYFLIGVAFPNPPASDPSQFAWRLAAWIICAAAFAAHIWFEHARGRATMATAFRAASAVALGAFAIAAFANIHAMRSASGVQPSMRLALAIWPIAGGLLAFVPAWITAAVLARLFGKRPVLQ